MYTFEKYVATPETAMSVLRQYGVAIIPSILNESECQAMNDGMWSTLHTLTKNWDNSPVLNDIPAMHATPVCSPDVNNETNEKQKLKIKKPTKTIRKEDPETWGQMAKLYPKHSMLIQNFGVGHAQYVWDVRQNPKVANVFAHIWTNESESGRESESKSKTVKEDDLLVSFDAVSYHMPPEQTKQGWYRNHDWFHCDQSYLNSSFQCVQGWVSGYDVREGDATLSILESSHLYHEDCGQRFGITDKADWYKLNPEQLAFYLEKGCEKRRICCPAGSLVLWDSRTIHCGTEAVKTRLVPNFRNIVYVCYQPRSQSVAKQIAKKQKAFNMLRMTTHWPLKVRLFGKQPQTYGLPVYETSPLDAPVLSELGLKLAGF